VEDDLKMQSVMSKNRQKKLRTLRSLLSTKICVLTKITRSLSIVSLYLLGKILKNVKISVQLIQNAIHCILLEKGTYAFISRLVVMVYLICQ